MLNGASRGLAFLCFMLLLEMKGKRSWRQLLISMGFFLQSVVVTFADAKNHRIES